MRIILGDDPRGKLIAIDQRDDDALRAEQHVVDGQDEPVAADQGAGPAPIGAEPNRGGDVRLGNLRMHSHRRARDVLQQSRPGVHRFRSLKQMPRGFKRRGPLRIKPRSVMCGRQKKGGLAMRPPQDGIKGFTCSKERDPRRLPAGAAPATAARCRGQARCTSDYRTKCRGD